MVSAAQISKVKTQWGSAGGEKFTSAFFHKLLAAHPELQSKFGHIVDNANPDFQRQIKVTTESFEKCINLAAAGKTAEYKKYLHELADMHKGVNVGFDDLKTGKDVISATAQEVVGSGVDLAAWEAVIGDIFDQMV